MFADEFMMKKTLVLFLLLSTPVMAVTMLIGDSPIQRRNQVLHAHAYALHVEDFQTPNGQKVQSQPFLENNNFGNSPVSGSSSASVAAQQTLR